MSAEDVMNAIEHTNYKDSAFLDVNPLTIILWVISLLSFYFSFRVYKMIQQQNKILNEADFSAKQSNDQLGGVIGSRRMSESRESNKIGQGTQPIYRIWVTGGPCAGKTTSLTTIRSHLQEKGFKVLEVPEAATWMMKGGCFIQTSSMTFSQAVKFQISLMQLQMSLEDIFIDVAINSGYPCVVLMDRGVMDGSAYCTPQVWKAILNETGWTTIQLRDRRYDVVCHLVTAADGAEEFYGKNNEARYESVEQAKDIDYKLIKAWTGHPHFKIIDNSKSDGFKGKIQNLIMSVEKYLGLPEMAHVQKKFLLKHDEDGRFIFNEPDNLKRETFEVEEVYLLKPNKECIECKIRSRGKEDSFTYIQETRSIINGEEIIMKRQITAREYIQLLDQKDGSMKQIDKKRHCFIFKNQNFVVDVFSDIEGRPTILRIETHEKSDEVEIPPFVKVLREVTDDKEYATYEMAQKKYEMPNEDILNTTIDVPYIKKNSISLGEMKINE